MNKQIHGMRPPKYVHIDCTVLNVVLVSNESKNALSRPSLSFAVDVESRGIVGFYLPRAAGSHEVSHG